MESGKCKHCGSPIFRGSANESWKHWGSLKELCFPAPVAEPIRDDSGAPEPDVPEAVGLIDCIESLCAYLRINGPSLEEVEAKCEAYRRGLRGK